MNLDKHSGTESREMHKTGQPKPQTVNGVGRRRVNGVLSNSSESKIAPELPVQLYKQEILEKVRNNPVTIITAETGAGKSTQVPQYLLEEGYRVIVTQPRRLAARSLAGHVAEQRKEDLGDIVGYQTADKNDSSYSGNTNILYCTDGLQVVRELTDNGAGENTALVLDEVHEWNTNMETLIAWAKKQMKEGRKFKLVIMSATLDAEDLAKFYDLEGKAAPTIDVPGKLFPIEEKISHSRAIVDETIRLAEKGRNVLVFQPGKREIQETIEELKNYGLGAVILPLHGELSPEEQKKVFKKYSKPKIIVSTNVAQTSVTINDIDAVVDSALERRIETNGIGVEQLLKRSISKADCTQRKGRAGRCKPGEYVYCGDEPFDNLAEYPKPEIQRVRLDQQVLRLANAGLDATKLEFYHQPDSETLEEAKRALIALGAMNEDGEVTKIGKDILKLPIDVHIGRMIIEAIKNDCVDDILTIGACLQVGGIRSRVRGDTSWKKLTDEDKSDLIAELEIYNTARKMTKEEMAKNGIHRASFFRAMKVRGELGRRMASRKINFGKGKNNGNRDMILRSAISGLVDHLYQKTWDGYMQKDDMRKKDNKSAVCGDSKWAVGVPKDIEVEDKRYGGTFTIKLLTMCSDVSIELMKEVAPHLYRSERKVIWSYDRVVTEEFGSFNGVSISDSQDVDTEANSAAVRCFCKAFQRRCIYNTTVNSILDHNEMVRREVRGYFQKSGGKSLQFTEEDEIDLYLKALKPYGIISINDFEKLIEVGAFDFNQLKADKKAIISDEEIEKIENENPRFTKLGNREIEIFYVQGDNGEFYALTSLGQSHIESLSAEQAPGVLPDGRRLIMKHKNYNFGNRQTTDIRELQKDIKDKSTEVTWREFQSKAPKSELILDVLQDLPLLPDPIEFDSVSGAFAYPAYWLETFSEDTYKLLWFRDKEEADERMKFTLYNKKSVGLRALRNKIDSLLQDVRYLQYEVVQKEGKLNRDIDSKISSIFDKLSDTSIEDTDLSFLQDTIETVTEIRTQLKENKKLLITTEKQVVKERVSGMPDGYLNTLPDLDDLDDEGVIKLYDELLQVAEDIEKENHNTPTVAKFNELSAELVEVEKKRAKAKQNAFKKMPDALNERRKELKMKIKQLKPIADKNRKAYEALTKLKELIGKIEEEF